MRKVPFAFLAFVALLLAAEFVASSVVGLGDPPLSEGAADIDYIFKPNQVCRRFGHRIAYNNLSMRCDFDVSEGFAGRRLIVAGDSVVNGGVLTDQDDLATSLLQKGLPAWQVCNVSAGSWGPGNLLAYFKRHPWLVRERDVLIVEVNSHDLWEDDPRTGQGAIVGSPSFPDKKPFCALSDGFCRYLLPKAKRWFGLPEGTREKKIDAVPEGERRAVLQNFNLKALETLYALPAQTKFLLVYRSRSESARPGQTSEGERILVEHAQRMNIPVMRVELDSSSDYRDTIHATESGQRKIAQTILKALETHD